MTKNEFKTGDRVRYIGDDNDLGYDLPLCNGADYVVAKVNDSEVDLETPYIFTDVDINDLELIEPLDRKTAFLKELQELLRRYDARIYDGDLYAIHIEIGYHGAKSEQADYLFYQSDNDEINADNIMDFDKE